MHGSPADNDSRRRFAGLPLVSVDLDAAVYRLELNRCSALADVGVDVITNLALDGNGEVHGDAAVYRLRDQVCGVVIRSLNRNPAIGRLANRPPPCH